MSGFGWQRDRGIVILDFEVRTWRGVCSFSPDALIAVSRGEVRRENGRS